MRTVLLSAFATASLLSTAAHAETANWDGFYAGPFAGYVDGKLTQDDPTHSQTTGQYDDNGFTAGIIAGYRKQYSSNLVIGGEVILPFYMDKGRAVDIFYFPGQVFYEAKPKLGAMVDVQLGYATGRALPYVYTAIGFAKVEGRTLNVDLAENYSPGFVQKASATPLVLQLGAGLDVQATPNVVLGGRVAYFWTQKKDYTMPWNEPAPNRFGAEAAYFQLSATYRFGGGR